MPSHTLIEAYLAELRRQLPVDASDELADGLVETYHDHLTRGLDPTSAAQATIAEFGTPDQITAAFARHAPGRRTAVALLATGPLIGLCWGGSLMVGHASTWPVPAVARIVFGLALFAVVAILAAVVTSRGNYRRTRWAAAGGAGLIALDAVMLVTVALAAPALVWPMAVAIPASLTRIGLTLRALSSILTTERM